jgi:hypothetical protein
MQNFEIIGPLLKLPPWTKIKESHCCFDVGRKEQKEENFGFRSSGISSRKWPSQKQFFKYDKCEVLDDKKNY